MLRSFADQGCQSWAALAGVVLRSPLRRILLRDPCFEPYILSSAGQVASQQEGGGANGLAP